MNCKISFSVTNTSYPLVVQSFNRPSSLDPPEKNPGSAHDFEACDLVVYKIWENAFHKCPKPMVVFT